MPNQVIEFPKFWSCPKCGSTQRLVQVVWHHLHPTVENPNLCGDQVVMAMPMLPTDLVPRAAIAYGDFCWECGTKYYWKVEIQQAHLQRQAPQPKGMPKNMRLN